MTIVVVTAQVVVNLQTVTLFRGGAPYPEPFATVVKLASEGAWYGQACGRVRCKGA